MPPKRSASQGAVKWVHVALWAWHCSRNQLHATGVWVYPAVVGTIKAEYSTAAGDFRSVGGAMGVLESLREATPEQARHLRKFDGERFGVNVTVTAVVPEMEKALVESDDGLFRLSISERTKGVCVRDLRPGQHLRVTLQGVLAPKVLSAKLA